MPGLLSELEEYRLKDSILGTHDVLVKKHLEAEDRRFMAAEALARLEASLSHPEQKR